MTNDSISLPRFQLDGAAKTGRPRDDADEGLFNSWFDPIEHAVRDRVRFFIEELIESELATVLARPRYGRRATDGSCVETSAGVVGHRHGSRTRTLTGTFGRTEIAVPRARLMQPDGGTTEWKSQALRAYQRRTRAAEALIASAYLAGVNTRRVRRALTALFGGAVGKDIVSRTWRKVKADWESWNARSLADEPIVRLILDGTVVRVRLDRKATAISLLVVIGVRADGQKVLLAVKSMGGESAEAWRAVLDGLIKRSLRRPEFLIVDGAAGLDAAIAAVWDGVPVQRCTVHKHRNLLAHAPERLHDEITADYTDMIYAATPEEIETRRKAFIRKWRLKHRAVADSLEEAGERLFAFTRLPPSQWKSARTTDEMDKCYFVTNRGTSPVCSLVRPRRWRSSVPTAYFTVAARRDGQGWPHFARPPQGLALIGPSTAACWIGSDRDCKAPDGWCDWK
jgi:putative transposase